MRWGEGSDEVQTLLLSLGGERRERKTTWTAKYGAEPKGKDFDVVRERAFIGLKGYDDDQGSLKSLVEDL